MAFAIQRTSTSVANKRSTTSAAFAKPAVSSVRAARVASGKVAQVKPFVAVNNRASIVAQAVAEKAEATEAKGQTQYYAVIANAEWMLNDPQNEPVAEQMRERLRYLNENGKERDFWFVPEPKWLDQKYPEKAKLIRRPCVALVTSDKSWMIFMKLRLDRVMRIDLGAVSKEEALAIGGKLPEFKPVEWTAPYSKYASGWWEKFMP